MPAQNNNFVNPHGLAKSSRLNLSCKRFWYNAQPHTNANTINAKKNPKRIYRVNWPNPADIAFQKLLADGHTNNALPRIDSGKTIGALPSREKPKDAINSTMVNKTIAETIGFFIAIPFYLWVYYITKN